MILLRNPKGKGKKKTKTAHAAVAFLFGHVIHTKRMGCSSSENPAITATYPAGHLHFNQTDHSDDYRLIFVSMTNILLLSSLISLMSMSLEGVSFSTIGFTLYIAPEANEYMPLGDVACQRGIPFSVSISNSLNNGCATAG